MEFLRGLWSEKDNQTPCPVRVVALGAVGVYHVGLAWVAAHNPIDMSALGMYVQHMATMVGIVGAAIGVKSVLKGDAS